MKYRAKGNVSQILRHYYNEQQPETYMYNIHVANSFEGCRERSDSKEDTLRGMVRENKIYINKQVLKNPAEATGTLLHELIHRYKGVDDASRRFENELTGISGFTTNEWTGNKEMFQKSLNALRGDSLYTKSDSFKKDHSDVASYLEGI